MSTSPQAQPLSPQQFAEVVERVINEPRPPWARKSLALLLNVIFPKISAQAWSKCLEGENASTRFTAAIEENQAWFLGRVARALSEAKTEGLLDKPPFAALPWLNTFEPKTGATTGGTGFSGFIVEQFQNAVTAPTSTQIVFWRSFADGFEHPVVNRRHDAKTVLGYGVLSVVWRDVQQCNSMREAFDWYRKRFPIDALGQHEDPVDFEERQFKWFEKLCQRNLGLALARRGRPTRRLKKPQS